MSKLPLTHLITLVTRPKNQAQELATSINNLGGTSIIFPTLEIVPLTDQSALTRTLKHLDQFNWAIFTSKNAVSQVIPYWPNSIFTKIAAIGASTAKAIIEFKLQVDACPEQEFSSEGLLNLPVFHKVKDQKIVIFTGENSRDLLSKELTTRGAYVSSIPVYRRQPPRTNITPLLSEWQSLNLIISTSNESLSNLVNLIPARAHSWLLQVPLLVISPRMQHHAKALGFCEVIVAANASDAEILETIKSWYYSKI